MVKGGVYLYVETLTPPLTIRTKQQALRDQASIQKALSRVQAHTVSPICVHYESRNVNHMLCGRTGVFFAKPIAGISNLAPPPCATSFEYRFGAAVRCETLQQIN